LLKEAETPCYAGAFMTNHAPVIVNRHDIHFHGNAIRRRRTHQLCHKLQSSPSDKPGSDQGRTLLSKA
jgi:hypothetical protein